MAFRVLQIVLPHGSGGLPEDLPEDSEIVGRWRDVETDLTVISLLIAAEAVEPIMDRLEKRFEDVEGFHVVLLPVEAVLPRPKPEPKIEKEETSPSVAADEPPNNGGFRISREELYAEAEESIGVNRVFMAMTVLSALVAAVGLMRNDVAVVIGAMVIAPLLGPNVAMTLAATLGEVDLLRRAFWTNLVGISTAFVFSLLIGVLFTINPAVESIASRTRLGYGDILLALSAGAAGSLAFTRGQSGAVIGVMVAVALMPPLVVCGMLIGSGYPGPAWGAGLLTAANVICVNLAGILTFIVQGVRPSGWRETVLAKKETRQAILIWTVLLVLLLAVLWAGRPGR